ncbi:MAG TPA: glycoside hydrolase domain-containing protein, partial [Phycisphaeraceae bacterium]
MALPLAGLADEPPADAKPFKLATPGLSVRINPSRAYTVDSIWLKEHLLGQPNGNYGFVYHAGEAKFIGSGHREGGQEQVDDVQLLVNGKPVAPPYPAQIRGERFEFIKRSRLNTILLTTRYQLDSDRLIESHEVEAAQPTFIMTSYAFMYPWSSTTTQWLARTLDGQVLEGSFDNEGWELKADVRWLALWEPKSQAVILTEFPPDLPRGQGIRHAIWDLKAYHKQYYQPWSNITLEPGVKHSFRVSVRAFHAEPAQWKDRAQAEAYEYEGGYQPQSESASQTQAEASAMQQAVEALYPPLDPSQTPAWLAEPVAMEALDPDTVLAPWQPVEASESEVKVWGRSYQLGDWALPRQVVAMGEPLLAEPARLELQLANQTDPLRPAQVNLAARHKGQVRYTAQAQHGEVTALMEGLYEYDGFSRFDLHLKGPEPVQVQRLSLVIPLREQEARFLQHASAWNLTMSQQLTAVSQAVPDGQGEVYRYGFSPFLWLGGYDRGLAWYAESDEHWYPFKNSSAIRLVRHKGRVELHIDL